MTVIDIPPFEDREVLSTTIAIRNAGDGLSKAMEIDPVVMHHHDKVYVVIECEVEKVRHDPIPETQALVRVHMLKAGTAVIVDKDLVDAQLREMEKRIEEHQGTQRLDLDGAQHALDHEDGKHADGLVAGCPECDAEAAASAAENDD